MNPPPIATIVLAAGSSSRLGTHKALLEINNKSAIRRVAETSLASMSRRSIIVLGASANAIKAELDDLPVEIVENSLFAKGRTGSLKCALRHLGIALADTAVLVFPVDCPFISYRLLNRLIECFVKEQQSKSESFWIVPEFKGRRGHPVLLSGPILSRIFDLADDFSLKEFLYTAKTHERSVRYIALPVESETVLDNINTRQDVLRIWKREGLVCKALP
jgi:molybdenum cofactor cytidylyltransferase